MGKVSLPALYIRDHAGLLTSLPSVGRSATHALVQAQLICSGAQQGMHAFIVPIRSLEDHSPLPGKLMLLPPGPLPGDPTRPPCPGGPRGPWEKLGHVSLGQGGVQLYSPGANWLDDYEQGSAPDLSLVTCKQV